MGKSGSGICCAIDGCPGTINDDDLNGKISPNLYTLYVQQRVMQKVLDDVLKPIIDNQQLNHRIVMSSLQDIKGRVQRALGAMAFLASNDVKKCPSLVWMVPTNTDGSAPGHTATDLISWKKAAVTRKYNLSFICQHTFTAVHPPIEIEVARDWVVQVAPLLRLGLFLLKTAAMPNGLPFPITDLPQLEQLSVMKDFVNSFLNSAAKQLLNSCEATFTVNTQGTIPHTDISQVRSLTGPAYDMISEKVNTPKRSHWKELMKPVMNHDGRSLIWVKNEYQHLYG
jgi:hypothetical protein